MTPTVHDRFRLTHLPILMALIILLLGGIFLLERADAQARDTIRKHHLQDIEQSLFFAQAVHGTFPPYDQPTWCGSLHDPASEEVRLQIEAVLREQNETYSNLEKPFPSDPNADLDEGPWNYFYWKRSPALFELYAQLEVDQNDERRTHTCPGVEPAWYDYGLTSPLREDLVHVTI